MSDAMNEEIQRLGLGAQITLYEIDMTMIGGPIMRFTPMSDPGEEGDLDVVAGSLKFGGEVYTPFPIYAEGFSWSSQGTPAQPTISIANINHAMTGYVLQYDNLIGAQFLRIRTFEKFLDTGSEPDPDAHMPIDVYRFERKTMHNDQMITWEMSSWIDQQGVKLPRRIVVRDYCDLIYRRPDGEGGFSYEKATCPYTGTNYFDRKNVACAAGDDKCSHTLKGCKLRFGENAHLPFGGFPGVAKFRV